MDADSVVAAIEESALAGVFSTELLQNLPGGGSWRRCPAGTILFHEGEKHDVLYLLHRGYVTLEMSLPVRGRIRLLTLGPGEILAWSALVGNGRMTATATADDDVELLQLPATELLRICELDPHFGYRLMGRLAAALGKRLLATRLQMLDLFATESASSNRGVS